MATTQKQASIGRTVVFRTKGVNYTAFLHASTGNLIQQYDDDGLFYPSISVTDPIRLTFTATSSASRGPVVPDSIVYKVAGVELAFDSTGKCTTSAQAELMFRKDGTDLLVIGNIADYLGYTSALIEAFATKGQDDIYAACTAEISKYQGGMRQKVSIAPGDNKSFTLTSQNDSIILKCGVLKKTGWVYNSPDYKYHWEISDPEETSGWSTIQSPAVGPGGTLTLLADEVNTYANIRCTVYKSDISDAEILGQSQWTSINFMPVGTDCVGVVDASDPLDILLSIKLNRTGTGAEVDVDELALDDSMPDNAYLLLTPTLVVRGAITSAGPTTWLTGQLTDPAGVVTRNVTPVSDKYKLMVSDFGGIRGEHTIVMHGVLN